MHNIWFDLRNLKKYYLWEPIFDSAWVVLRIEPLGVPTDVLEISKI